MRAIAYYLPQFHPIPENDAWWGEDFTEWTNVRPARPQFVGHYQPHEPGELGYYDLRDPKVQRRQIELAKLHGLGGFCFYYYWFGGKRLLETPIDAWLDDPSLDFPFCLCWANENWSRRWDGLEQEILIAQDHSVEDDLAVIADMARYIRDPRYIRVGGRPLIIMYRPSLLPSPRETVARWRAWCRENGIGEIHLAYTQSFEITDPDEHGFDAAIEFPPNNSAPPDITETVVPLDPDFGTTVYDWSVFPRRSAHSVPRSYPLYRGVCPGWDNTARRKKRGIAFVNNTPGLYRRWLEHAVRDTVENVSDPSSRLIFINAWNEWAEGAHLEPDRATGYAYLNATRDALIHAFDPPETPETARAAIAVHAFYPDVLDEILEFAGALPARHKLFVTTSPANEEIVHRKLADTGRDFVLEAVPNRGRDVLPFLRVIPTIRAEGFSYVIKVHTKKSTHRIDGEIWRRDLYRQLLAPEALDTALRAFIDDPYLGMIGPEVISSR